MNFLFTAPLANVSFDPFRPVERLIFDSFGTKTPPFFRPPIYDFDTSPFRGDGEGSHLGFDFRFVGSCNQQRFPQQRAIITALLPLD